MERVQHSAYGYFDPSEEYYRSIIQWQEKRNGVTGLKPEHIGYENGVLGGAISALNVMCSKGTMYCSIPRLTLVLPDVLKTTDIILYIPSW